MDLQQVKSVYFLGIGGIGMSALARYFLRRGVRVSGYDRSESPLTRELCLEGASIHYTDDPALIPSDCDLAVRTPAIPAYHNELHFIGKSNIPFLKRAELLGMITSGSRLIAVAGTHGKTTTSSLISWLFLKSSFGFLAFLGGILKNNRSNFLEQNVAQVHPAFCIAEADEYDRSFLHLNPDITVVTSMDPDHLDIYGNHEQLVRSFHQFIRQIRPGGTLIHRYGLNLVPEAGSTVSHFSYGLSREADFRMESRRITDGFVSFDLVTPGGVLPGFRSALTGQFNEENTVAALAACITAGIPAETLRAALPLFQGVVRRFDVRIRREDFLYIDDYAHHPEEIRACISAVRELFPGKRITGVFQPHLFTRTRDLADGFATELSKLDNLVLLDIYPAREKPIEGVTSRMILDQVHLPGKFLSTREELIPLLRSLHPEILVTLGAGDIDQLVEPVIQAFS